MNYHWRITYRAKKSPYVLGLEKRRGEKLPYEEAIATISGNNIHTRADAIKAFKDWYSWAVIVKSKREAIK